MTVRLVCARVEAATVRRLLAATRRTLRGSAATSGLVGLLALVALANLVVLLAQASALVHSLYLNADNASALVLAALAGHAPAGAVVNLGNHPSPARRSGARSSLAERRVPPLCRPASRSTGTYARVGAAHTSC